MPSDSKGRTPARKRSPAGGSHVDRMIGSAELRTPKAGADPLFEALHERLVADRNASRRRRR